MHQRRLHAEVSTSKLQEQAHPQQTAESSLCSEAKADSANGVGGADAKERRGEEKLGWRMELKSGGACDLCERVGAGELRTMTHDVVTGPALATHSE